MVRLLCGGVIPLRFERRTYCLEGSCSIQLSYGTWSGHPDSNWGSPAPKAGAITGLRYIPSPLQEKRRLADVFHSFYFGGEGGIRTPGTLIEYDSLANCWFQPLTHLSVAWGFQRKNAFFAIEIGCKSTNFFSIGQKFLCFCPKKFVPYFLLA